MTNHPKIVLITGAAVRIGKWIAESMASDGWSVALHCNTNYKAAENLAEKIRGQGGIAEVFRANLACEDDVEKFVGKIRRKFSLEIRHFMMLRRRTVRHQHRGLRKRLSMRNLQPNAL